MALTPTFDLTAAHRFFAASCFNQSWQLIDKPQRAAEEDEQLIALGHASLWHWTQHSDCGAKNLSIAHWLPSRIYALVGDVTQARRYAESCLRISAPGEVAPMFLGYAYEALARAEQLAGDGNAAGRFLQVGSELAEKVEEEDDRKQTIRLRRQRVTDPSPCAARRKRRASARRCSSRLLASARPRRRWPGRSLLQGR